MSGRESLFSALPPLDTAAVLWLAAIDRVPIEERVEWVKSMGKRVEQINAMRAATPMDPAPVGGLRDWCF